MNYEQALDYIHSRPRFSARAGLGRIHPLLAALGNPQQAGRFVHIGGTNGKGSTAAMTASCLQAAGYRTGLFTSPYLLRFEERFQINGCPIGPEELASITTAVRATEEQLEQQGLEPVNEFELVTAIGFVWFARQSCDYVVLEVGLGGSCDPTNVLQAPACVAITSISLDHTAQLGSTVAQIAGEKAGIIKPHGPVVTPATQAPEALAIIRAACTAQQAPLHLAALDAPAHCGPEGTQFSMGQQRWTVPLLGRHQAENAAVACTICQLLGLPPATIRQGLARTLWPGRLQLVSRQPMVLVDCAHNPGGIATLAENLQQLFPSLHPVLLMTMMADKAHAPCIGQISALARRLYATSLPLPRALPAEAVAQEASCPEVYAVEGLRPAIAQALASLQGDEILVLCGSVFLAGAALPILQELLAPAAESDR